jgi:hypothetical protein
MLPNTNKGMERVLQQVKLSNHARHYFSKGEAIFTCLLLHITFFAQKQEARIATLQAEIDALQAELGFAAASSHRYSYTG